MTSNLTTTANEDFAARVARIKAGGVGSKGTVYVGQDEAYYQAQVFKTPPSKIRELAENSAYVGGFIGAFVLGMFGVAFGRYVRFQVLAGQEFAADTDMMISGGMGAVASFVLAQMFRLDSKEQRSLQAIGVFAMVCVFHNFVHWAPGVFQTVFSPEWVQQVQTTTKPNSLLFRGVSFVLDPEVAATEADSDLAALESEGTTEVQAGMMVTPQPSAAKAKPQPKKARMPGGAKFEAVPQN